MADRGRVVQVLNNLFSNAALGDALTAAGCSALATGEHQELASIIHAEQPALVLLDLILPGTDGIELMERVPELADLPVIFISGYGRDETIARALEAGAADTLLRQAWRRRSDDRKVVRAFVRNVRRKLGDDPNQPAYIVTERGVGYRMARPHER